MDQFFLIDGLCEKFDLSISDEDAQKYQECKGRGRSMLKKVNNR